MHYYATANAPRVRDLMSAGVLRTITTPRAPTIPPGARWCGDNGCYGVTWPGASAWLAWLHRYTPEERRRCDFVVAPDVVGDAAATWARAVPYLPAIRLMGYPAAYVAQDGAETVGLPWGAFDVLFIGGTTAFKLGPHARAIVARARALGLPVHMGRVNSERRLRYAQHIGCDSADGTYLAFGADRNLPNVLAWLRGVAHPRFTFPDEPAELPVPVAGHTGQDAFEGLS